MVDYDRLYRRQDALIEHKYPITGIWEYEISNAGDVFRGLSKDYVDPSYVCEKIGSLRTFVEKQPLNRADFEEFKYYSTSYEDSAEVVKAKKERFRSNLKQLREETMRDVTDAVRRKCLVDSLDMIKALADYYERSPSDVPLLQWRRMKRSVNKCLPKPCSTRKGKRLWF